MSEQKIYSNIIFSPENGFLQNTEKGLRKEICLNGYWAFQGINIPENYKIGTAPPELTKYDNNNWEKIKIKIPSPWDVNNFTGDSEKPGGDFINYPSYPKKWNHFKMAWHKKTISIPESWEGNNIFLHFEAICGYAEVYLNEEKIGEHFDLSLPVTFDISKEALPGKTYDLYVGIRDANFFNINGKRGKYTYPTGSFWCLNIKGIWQDVYLLSYPKVYIKDIFIQPDLKKNLLKTEITIKNDHNTDITLGVDGVVKQVISKSYNKEDILHIGPQHNININELLNFSKESVSISPNTECKIFIKKDVNNHLKLWNPDNPILYAVIFNLYIDNKKIDTKYQRFGWRQFLIENGNLTLNGENIQILGDSWHFMGIPQLTRRYAFAWYRAIKDAGGNGVRLHAMPFPRYYLELAEEMGICVLDESAIWASHGSFNYDEDITWERFENHIRALILRDRNYASVIGWSIENEIMMALSSTHSPPIELLNKVKSYITRFLNVTKELDPTRDWISGDGLRDWEGILPTCIIHYGRPRSYKRTKKLKNKPCGVGKCTIGYFGTPIHASKFIGDNAFYSIYNRMCAVALDAYKDLKYQINANFSYCSVFNLAWYGLKPLPLGHINVTVKPDINNGIYFKDYVENKPGIQPERLGPYSSTFNPGYDEDLPLYSTWPLFEAIKSAFNKNEFQVPIEKNTFKKKKIINSDNSIEAVYIGDNNFFFKELRKCGCVLSKNNSSSIKIIDMRSINENDLLNIKNEIKTQSNNKYIFLNIEKIHKLQLTNLLNIDIEINKREASSLVYNNSENIISNYFDLSELYFSESENQLIQEYSISVISINEIMILLESCSCDWTYWNSVPEYTKTGALYRSEKESKVGSALVNLSINKNEILLSTILFKPIDTKRINLLLKLLQIFGIKIDENKKIEEISAFHNNVLTNLLTAGYFKYNNVNDALTNEKLIPKLNDLPYVGKTIIINTFSTEWINLSAKDEIFNFKELKLKGNSENGFVLICFYLDSIRRIDDLLTEPNVPELFLNLNTDCIYNLYLNDNIIASSSKFKAFNDIQKYRLLLKKGKNLIILKIINRRDFKLRAFLSSNNTEYLISLKS